jgi:hypothetical protein
MVAAAAPNRSSIGGAGTSVGGPPEELVDEVELPLWPPLDEEVELDELVDEDVEDEVDEDVEVDEEVELEVDDEVELEVLTLPEEVEVELEVLTLPDEVETLPDDVLTLPDEVEVEVEMLPELVEVELPPELVLVDPPDDEVEPPEVEVEPVLVEVITTCPPELPPPPPKKPPKKPPPKPPPPQPPPITTGAPPPEELIGCCGRAGISGIAAMAICGAGSQVVVRVITRRMRLTWRGAAAICRRARTGALATLTGAATFACFTYSGRPALGLSATWTAPPPMSAPPAA